MEGAVFVQSNAAHNEVIAFSRAADGSLAPAGTFATGGAGDDNAHLPSQGSVTLTRDRRHLLVTNVASNDVSVLRREWRDGRADQDGAGWRGPAEHRGARWPRVRARHRRRDDPRVPPRRRRPCTGGRCERTLSTPDGAQVGFTPDGRALSRPSVAATSSPPSQWGRTGCSARHERSTRSARRPTGSRSHRTGRWS